MLFSIGLHLWTATPVKCNGENVAFFIRREDIWVGIHIFTELQLQTANLDYTFALTAFSGGNQFSRSLENTSEKRTHFAIVYII